MLKNRVFIVDLPYDMLRQHNQIKLMNAFLKGSKRVIPNDGSLCSKDPQLNVVDIRRIGL